MKYCPRCQQQYPTTQNICPEDGELLLLGETVQSNPEVDKGETDTPTSEAMTWWRNVDQLLDAALERDPEVRATFIAAACAGDENLRNEVESLLAAHERAGSLSEATPAEAAMSLFGPEPAQSMVGQVISHYQLRLFLGAGGMGEVYLAHDIQLGRKVALKLLPIEFTQDRERVHRFKQEARTTSALNHPNILTIFEIGQADRLHFIAAEFIDGKTLRQRLAGLPMKLSEALDVAIQVASALTAAHEAGIVHRDIKPENIMLRHDSYVKVLDFGLAKLIEPLQTNHTTVAEGNVSTIEQVRTDPTKVIGTPRYMAPEQIRAQQVDGRTDIFGLGVVLYELVAGRAPFEGATSLEVIAAILTADAPPLGRYFRDPPPELERIISRALRKDRGDRYQTARDLLIDLKNLKLELELELKLKHAEGTKVRSENTIINHPSAAPTFDLAAGAPFSQESILKKLEPVGGAVPLDSQFYIVRPVDEEFQTAIARRDSIVLVKGARQVGKTSLLARGLQQAREAGAKIVLTDFQKLAASYLESVERLLLTLAESFADQLDLDIFPVNIWNPHLSPGINFERYLRRVVFSKVPSPIVWGLDEVDRVFTCTFGSEIFGLFRSWHNERALDPQGPWRRFTLTIAYATEAHLFITDLNQSPFNVGTRLALSDFSFDQVMELNQRHGNPLRDKAEAARYFRLVGGHPYLVRRGLHEMVAHGLRLADLEAQADHDEGPFGDHLRRLFVSLTQDPALSEVMRGMLQGKTCPTPESFYRLWSAGLISGDAARTARPRCQLYATYLERHLL